MDSQDVTPGSGDMASEDPAVAQRPGAGASFTPGSSTPAEPATEPAAEPSIGSGGGPAPAGASLLLVDNDARIVELLTWFLTQRGHDVRTAASFVEARERLAERAPDLLVSDVDLGAESAVQELPRLRADGILPRTLVVSGYLDAANEAALTALPEVAGTLSKPFEFTDLEAAIERALAGADEPPPLADVEVPRPERHSVRSSEEERSGGGAAADGDEDEDGWIEITPGH